MRPASDSLRPPRREAVSELVAWRPSGGVLSLYLRIEPGDRSAKWRTELRHGLEALQASGSDGEALRRSAARLKNDLDADPPHPDVRGLIAFVEIAHGAAEERWFASRMPPRRTEVAAGSSARVGPLLQLLDAGGPLGVALVSGERVRLLAWEQGELQELHSWELSYFADQWRERKARRSDTARGDTVSASGHDRHQRRLDDNRERFVEQAGKLASGAAASHAWTSLLVFGEERYARRLGAGFNGVCPVRHGGDADLVGEPEAAIAPRIAEAVKALNRARELELIASIRESAYTDGRSALDHDEVGQCLAGGRVEHLVYDPGLPDADRLVELALASGAALTPVEDEAAEALAESGGAIAQLRY